MPVCYGRIEEIRVQVSPAMAALVYLQGASAVSHINGLQACGRDIARDSWT